LVLCSLRIFSFHSSSIRCLYNSSKVPAFWFSVLLWYFPFVVLQSFVYTTVLRFQHFGSALLWYFPFIFLQSFVYTTVLRFQHFGSLFSWDISLSYFFNLLFRQQFLGSRILTLCSLRIFSVHSSSIRCVYNSSEVPGFWFSVLLWYFPVIFLQSFVYITVLRFQHFGSLSSYDICLSYFFIPLFMQQFVGSSILVLCSLRILSVHSSSIFCLYNSSKVPAFWFSAILGYFPFIFLQSFVYTTVLRFQHVGSLFS